MRRKSLGNFVAEPRVARPENLPILRRFDCTGLSQGNYLNPRLENRGTFFSNFHRANSASVCDVRMPHGPIQKQLPLHVPDDLMNFDDHST